MGLTLSVCVPAQADPSNKGRQMRARTLLLND